MTIPEYCIKRPVFTVVLSLMLMITGLIYFNKLPVRHLPDIERPSVTIATDFDGASPQLVEKEITIPIENVLGSIAGVDNLRSVSQLGKSRIHIDFQLDTDINDLVSDIRNKMSALQNELPQGSLSPIVSKNDADANPVVVIGFHDEAKTPLEITDYIARNIKPILQETPGTGEVVYHGAREYAVKIALDPVKMAARQITVAEIKDALSQQNIDVPSGQIKSHNRYYTVVTHARLEHAHKFSELVVAQRNHQLIRLRDVANVSVGSQNEDNLLRINGKPAVGLAILAQSTANPVEVVKAVRANLKLLTPTFPPHFKADIVFDATHFIQQSIHEVYVAFIEAALCVGLVVMLFLGSLRAALIPIITIPICLVSVFWPMHWFGFELNTLTLLAMVLAIGLVVDDAIVVLENCHRHQQTGSLPREAAIKGTNEIIFAIVAMTITLAAVYAPMAFVNGFTGKLFFQFGTTLALCVILSGIIALTLSPMMCARLPQNKEGRYARWLNEQFLSFANRYDSSLRYVFNKPRPFMLILVAVSLFGIFCYHQLGSELAPMEDQSYIIGPVASPTNASTSYTDKYTRELERIYDTIPEKLSYLTSVKPATAFTLLQLVPWNKRTRSQEEISQELGEKMEHLTGVNAYPAHPNPFGQRAGNNQFSLALLGNASYLRLNDVSNEMVRLLQTLPELKNVKNNLALDSEQINIKINRRLAADLDVNLADVAESLSTMLGGNSPINFNYDGQTYKVILQLKHAQRRDISILNKLYIKSMRKKMIPLASLIEVDHSIGPDNLPHLHRLRTAGISALLAPGARLDDAIRHTQEILKKTLPDDIQYRFTGTIKDYLESSSNSLYAFLLALLFIFLVLSAQFESFVTPLIVLLSVPLCLFGALISLYLTGQNLSIYANIGMVTLIGLISKHGILITEFANQHKNRGADALTAIMHSTRTRLRPILMTTLAMSLGALPLALATGAGAESRRQLGIVIIGGMLIGTFFSLYVVPVAYMAFSSKKKASHLALS